MALIHDHCAFICGPFVFDFEIISLHKVYIVIRVVQLGYVDRCGQISTTLCIFAAIDLMIVEDDMAHAWTAGEAAATHSLVHCAIFAFFFEECLWRRNLIV